MDPGGFFWAPYGAGAGGYPHLNGVELGADDVSQPAVAVMAEAAVSQQDSLANEVDEFLDDFLQLAGDVSDDGTIHGVGAGSGAESMIDIHGDLNMMSLWKSDVGPLPSSGSPGLDTDDIVVDVGDDDYRGQGVSDEKREDGDFEEEEEEEEEGDPSSSYAEVGTAAAPCDAGCEAPTDPSDIHGQLSEQEKLRRQKVARYLEKKKRRQWSREAPYKNRQRVANSRPRHKGRFLPLESEFVPIVELQRRQRASLKLRQEQQVPGADMAKGEADDG